MQESVDKNKCWISANGKEVMPIGSHESCAEAWFMERPTKDRLTQELLSIDPCTAFSKETCAIRVYYNSFGLWHFNNATLKHIKRFLRKNFNYSNTIYIDHYSSGKTYCLKVRDILKAKDVSDCTKPRVKYYDEQC